MGKELSSFVSCLSLNEQFYLDTLSLFELLCLQVTLDIGQWPGPLCLPNTDKRRLEWRLLLRYVKYLTGAHVMHIQLYKGKPTASVQHCLGVSFTQSLQRVQKELHEILV